MDVAPAPVPPARDWSELPLDVLSFLFVKLGAIDVLMGAVLVCHSWLQAAKAPDVWRCVKMECHKFVRRFKYSARLLAMAKVAVDRSDGQLQMFAGERFVTNELLIYIAERSPSLKSLCLKQCQNITNEVFIEAMPMM
ncbi:F-box protein SKIP19-like [Triticum aestivum]|uniref:F-box protein SKIP19-like n=1 Tax=Triticum aestivum TaxID=4565 RepID=UPI001D003E35|nr:F-box protein SKIP19-like [Triticum aestivum]